MPDIAGRGAGTEGARRRRHGSIAMITGIEDYFARGCGRCARFGTPACSTQAWARGLAALRAICLEAGLEETVKWGHPCYVHAGRNIALLGAFRGDFRLTFMNAALLRDPEAILEKRSAQTPHADMIRFTDAARVSALAPVIAALLAEAMGYARDGIRPEREAVEIELPDELSAALDDDPELAEAFHGLTPGRQRSYVLNLAGAARPETRIARIARFRARILEGKGANER
jgi:uncharacterized protein YdeI (YjbR/CyaY-like superfamily)